MLSRLTISALAAFGTAAVTACALAAPAGASTGPAAASASQSSASSQSSQPSRPVVVVSGLNNPRQLTFGPGYSLLVAEAGRGARHPDPAQCISGPDGEQTCIGTTGSITRVDTPWRASQVAPHRIITGLISGGAADGGSAVGSDGVAYRAGSTLIQETYAPVPPGTAGGWQLGKLLRASGGHLRSVANISAVEFRRNPDGLQKDTNPYGLLAVDRHTSITADAAANDLIRVHNGRPRPLTVFPLHGCGGHRTQQCDRESVPTSLAWGPGHAIYVGELAHFEPGAARVWKVSPSTGRLLGYYGTGGSICRHDQQGFSTITGVAFGPDGSLYVSELVGGPNGSGDVVKISPTCHRSSVDVPLPGGIVVGSAGNVYVSAFSISDADGASPGGGAPNLPPGQVWRLRL